VVGTAATPEVRKIQSRLQSIIAPIITTPLSEKNRSDKTNLRRRCKDRPTRNEARGGSGGKNIYRGVNNNSNEDQGMRPGRNGKLKFSLDGSETNPSKFEATKK